MPMAPRDTQTPMAALLPVLSELDDSLDGTSVRVGLDDTAPEVVSEVEV